MTPETEALLRERYKHLCQLIDDYRERGFDPIPGNLMEEMKMVFEALRDLPASGEPPNKIDQLAEEQRK